MIYWVCGKGFARSHAQMGKEKRIGKWFEPMGRYVLCGVTLAVYVLGIVVGGL